MLLDEEVVFEVVIEGKEDVEVEDAAVGVETPGELGIEKGAETEVGVALAVALELVKDTFWDVLAGRFSSTNPSIASWLPELTIERLCLPGASPLREKSSCDTGADFCGMPEVKLGVVFENAKVSPPSTMNVALVPSSPAHQPYTFTEVPLRGVSCKMPRSLGE